MRLIAAYKILNENNIWFKASIEAARLIFDNIVIVDGGSTDGTLDWLESLNDPKIEIHYKKDKGIDGQQRNAYLDILKNRFMGDWCLVVDADEVISDNGFLLRNIAEQMEQAGAMGANIHMIHFIWNICLEDATQPRHYALSRFFKIQPNLSYDEVEHPVLQGFANIGSVEDVTLFHFSYVKGISHIIEKYHMNLKRSNMHTKEFLNDWKNKHVLGTYPVRPFTNFDSLPWTIKKVIADA